MITKTHQPKSKLIAPKVVKPHGPLAIYVCGIYGSLPTLARLCMVKIWTKLRNFLFGHVLTSSEVMSYLESKKDRKYEINVDFLHELMPIPILLLFNISWHVKPSLFDSMRHEKKRLYRDWRRGCSRVILHRFYQAGHELDRDLETG